MYKRFLKRVNGYLISKISFVLVMFFVMVSCKEKYEIYQENNHNIAQLISIDKIEKKAYLINYLDTYDKTSFKSKVEKIANFYKIEGYNIIFYKKKYIDTAEKLNVDFTVFSPEYEYIPYEYRNEYISEKGDTIARLLYRDGTKGFLYTYQKYLSKDTLFLTEIFKYLGLNSCFIYDKPNSINFESDLDYYSKYDCIDGFLFLSELHSGDLFSIDDVNVMKYKETEIYVKYFTNKYLSREQMLKILSVNKLSNKQNIVYFYLSSDSEKDYASIIYWGNCNKYSIFMYGENKEYEYDISSKKWSFIKDYNEYNK